MTIERLVQILWIKLSPGFQKETELYVGKFGLIA